MSKKSMILILANMNVILKKVPAFLFGGFPLFSVVGYQEKISREGSNSCTHLNIKCGIIFSDSWTQIMNHRKKNDIKALGFDLSLFSLCFWQYSFQKLRQCIFNRNSAKMQKLLINLL